MRFNKCFLSAIFYFVRLNCFISINLLIKFMFFSSANVFIWKFWLWFYSLAPTYSVTFEEFLDNCSSHFEKYVFIDRYSKDGRVRSKFIGISSPDKPDANGILKALFVTLKRLGFDESTLKKNGGVCMRRSICNAREDGRCCNKLRAIQPSLVIVHCLVHRWTCVFLVLLLPFDVFFLYFFPKFSSQFI